MAINYTEEISKEMAESLIGETLGTNWDKFQMIFTNDQICVLASDLDGNNQEFSIHDAFLDKDNHFEYDLKEEYLKAGGTLSKWRAMKIANVSMDVLILSLIVIILVWLFNNGI